MIAREQALGLGMTPKMVRGRLGSGRWIGVHAAVYRSAEAPFGWHGRLMAACLALGPRAVVSHRAAAALWGLDGCEEGLVELTLGGVGERRLRGVRMHRTRSLSVADRTQRDGLPITRVARTLIDLAAVVEEEPLEAALDSALREGLISVAHLDRRLGALGSKGRRGAERLRRLVDERRGDARPADSRRENRLVRHLEAAGLPRPVKQFELRDESGLIARFDLAYPDARIGVEFDSYRHHYGRQAWRRDQSRHNRATAAGWLVFHLTEHDNVGPIVQALESSPYGRSSVGRRGAAYDR